MMNHSSPKNETPQSADSKASIKKPYTKPEVRHERVFETMALACGKVQVTQHACRFNRKTS